MRSLFLFFLTVQAATASAVELIVWHPTPDHHAIILPVPEGMTPELAARSYLAQTSDPSLANVFNETTKDFPIGRFSALPTGEGDRRTLLIGNTGTDLLAKNDRINNFLKPLAERAHQVYVLVPVSDLHVPPRERAQFRQLIIQHFPFLIAMGGADIDPAMYGEKNDGSVNTNAHRDIAEFQLIRDYIDAARGFIFGICRGHQMINVVLGRKIKQHVPRDFGTEISHRNVGGDVARHTIYLIDAAWSLFRQTYPLAQFESNSSHHQAVYDEGPNRWSDVIGKTSDGVVEIVEFKNGRGITTQAHPEWSTMPWAHSVWDSVFSMKHRAVPMSCQHVF